ncbi:hypothetical protein MN116_000085 [Schistosoma mekongi]|uniref:DUF4806 domain-containing protein n=1 Tax=Schistosoma mekongi TaxID=38744 RepID=A0AAE2D3Q5_SCHME|nr:hypothetical protein MN116_000085 [Schistosoma mekongi]
MYLSFRQRWNRHHVIRLRHRRKNQFFAKLDSNIQKILNVLTDMSGNIVQVMGLLKTAVKESGTNQFHTRFTNLQFPLSTEDEVELLETSLVQESRRDSFVSLVTRLMCDDCKTSMKYILGYILQPELAVKFTLFGTAHKRSILTYKFYRSIKNALTSKFLSSTMTEKSLVRIYDSATQGFFHDMQDKLNKRYIRNLASKDKSTLASASVCLTFGCFIYILKNHIMHALNENQTKYLLILILLSCVYRY